MNVAAARASDLTAIRELLAASGLPGEDLTPAHLDSFWVQRDATGLVGVVGIEVRGRAALLRSLAVRGDGRGHGLGAALVAHAESRAAALGADTVYLLTTTAERFFAARGYAVTPRAVAPPEIQATAEFAELCPSSSICMTKRVAP
jgi:amino-acid N-acetyltransferase